MAARATQRVEPTRAEHPGEDSATSFEF